MDLEKSPFPKCLNNCGISRNSIRIFFLGVEIQKPDSTTISLYCYMLNNKEPLSEKDGKY